MAHEQPFTLVASVAPPIVNGSAVMATFVAISGTKAYVAYNTIGKTYGGAVDIIDISIPQSPRLLQSVLLRDSDLAALFVSSATGRLYTAGARDRSVLAAAFGRPSIEGINPSIVESFALKADGTIDPADLSSRTAMVPGYVANGVFETSLSGDYLFVTSGNSDYASSPGTGGTYALNRNTLKMIDADYYNNAQYLDIDDASGMHVSLQGGPEGILHTYKVGSADASSHKKIGIGDIGSAHDAGTQRYEGKNTVELYNNLAFVAAGSGGMRAYDLLSLSSTPVYEVPLDLPADAANPADWLCNSVDTDGDFVFMANGAAGLQVASFGSLTVRGQTATRATTRLDFLGSWMPEPGASPNFVKADRSGSGLVFLATGTGGLKILKVNDDVLIPPAGTARISEFQISAFTNPSIPTFPISARVSEDSDSGLLSAILPGGSSTSVTVDAVLTGGTARTGSRILTFPAVIDLTVDKKIDLVDTYGRVFTYDLDIGETGLPSVYIATAGGAPIVSKDDYLSGTVAISGGTAPYAMPLSLSTMKIKGRGNSTWDAPKKPYRIKLDSARSVLGMPAAKDWVLLANYFDKSLVRNATSLQTAAAVFPATMPFVPRMKFVDVYLNGVYNGNYLMGDQVEVGTSRVNIGSSSATETDTAYLLEANRWIKTRDGGVVGYDFFETVIGKLIVEYKTPKNDTITAQQRAWISAYFADIETALSKGSGFESLIDTASFIDWAIVEEFFKNTDSAFVSSVFMYRRASGKLCIGPVWDFDLSAGNASTESISLRYSYGWETLESIWYKKMLSVPSMRTAFSSRWNEVKAELYETAMSSITDFDTLIRKSAPQNFVKWPISTPDWINAYPLSFSHADHISAYRNWLTARFAWMDSAIGSGAF
jgi:hypothetical protein